MGGYPIITYQHLLLLLLVHLLSEPSKIHQMIQTQSLKSSNNYLSLPASQPLDCCWSNRPPENEEHTHRCTFCSHKAGVCVCAAPVRNTRYLFYAALPFLRLHSRRCLESSVLLLLTANNAPNLNDLARWWLAGTAESEAFEGTLRGVIVLSLQI